MKASLWVQHMTQRVQHYLPRRGSLPAYLIAVALTAMALFARLVMAPVDAGWQYVTFFPAVTLAVVIGGFGPGLLATLIGIGFATFLFTPPYYALSLANLQNSFWANVVFLADGLIVCFLIEAMHRYHQKYMVELAETRLASDQLAFSNEALRESETFRRSVFDSRTEQVAVLDAHGVIIAVNQAWHRSAVENGAPGLGRNAVGLNYLNVCNGVADHPGGAEAAPAAAGILAVLQGEKDEFSLAYPCHSPTEERWFMLRVTPLQGARQGVVVAHENISQRKAMEKVLMHHAAIVESSQDAIIGKTLEGIITSWNPGAEKVFGFTREEVLGRHISLLIPPDCQKAEDEVLALVRQGIAQTHYQTVNCRKDGQLIDISATLSPLRDATGKIVGVSKIARDITEQKRIEQEIRIAATAFEAQEGMMVTDANNIILRVNRAFSLNTGYSAQEAVGQHVRLLRSRRHNASFYADMWATVGHNGFWQGEIWNRRKNGEVYPEWLTITAVKAPTGETTHYVGTHTDITSRKAAEDEIRHLAFYDPLRRLPNRRLLIDRLHHALATAIRMQRLGALMFIDLDKFKILNDTLGHDKGDLLLQQVAERLVTCVREGDTVARLGGDEFVVILEVLSEDTQNAFVQADSLGRKVLATLGQTYLLDGDAFDSTPSIGISLFGPRACSTQELLKEADTAMYEAKAAGGNTLRFFADLDAHSAMAVLHSQ